ncbi:hypothetical protein C5Y97_23870 [Blastopirellula marina]|uniref:Uncharacterized protein n=1 Tax=Blastopirellula marina TaxID=124 RepID=A0A2S8FA49_9BACT|nr:hypothetical protein C5Y98_23855 [Blastopirellula marina]PTL42087.1 hypothetical protein C5Y97_23870 [Blastopirellula marina]
MTSEPKRVRPNVQALRPLCAQFIFKNSQKRANHLGTRSSNYPENPIHPLNYEREEFSMLPMNNIDRLQINGGKQLPVPAGNGYPAHFLRL